MRVASSMSEPRRVAGLILENIGLWDAELTVSDFVAVAPVPHKTVTAAMAHLERSGYVVSRIVDSRRLYRPAVMALETDPVQEFLTGHIDLGRFCVVKTEQNRK